MPDRVDLVGEEELMPGKMWLVYRNQRTGQLHKVPKEIMAKPETSKIMLDQLSGNVDPAYESAHVNDAFRVGDARVDMRRMSPDPSRPWVPPGHDFAPMGATEEMVPQSPLEAIQLLRKKLSGPTRRDAFSEAMTAPVGQPEPGYKPRGPAGGGVVY